MMTSEKTGHGQELTIIIRINLYYLIKTHSYR